MSNYDDDEFDDDDEQFYRETVYNEEYYLEQENEVIRQSNLELELEALEAGTIRELREEGVLRPTLIEPGKQRAGNHAPAPVDQPDDPDESF